ncbi:MAG TPA: hypothetical protein VK810_00625, partial [Dongiaceae bacterium]|nr:hypothetical protein [Dongiaceae bacterium]
MPAIIHTATGGEVEIKILNFSPVSSSDFSEDALDLSQNIRPHRLIHRVVARHPPFHRRHFEKSPSSQAAINAKNKAEQQVRRRDDAMPQEASVITV